MLNVRNTVMLCEALESAEAKGYRQITDRMYGGDGGYCFYGFAAHIFNLVPGYFMQCVNMCDLVAMVNGIIGLKPNDNRLMVLNDGALLATSSYDYASVWHTTPHRIHPHSFQRLAKILRTRLRAEQEWLITQQLETQSVTVEANKELACV